MAVHLIRRCTRLLAASSSFNLPSCALPPECITVCHHIQRPPRQTTLHTSVVSRSTANVPECNPSVTVQTDNDFSSLAKSASGVEHLLELSSEHVLDANKAAMIINQISLKQMEDRSQVLNDRRFENLLILLTGQIRTVWNRRLLTALKSLYALGLDGRSQQLQAVEKEVLLRLRRMSIESLAYLSTFMVKVPHAKDQKLLQNELLKNIEFRWMEVNDAKTLMTLFSRLSLLSSSLIEKLEDKVLQQAEHFTPTEARNVISVLAAQNHRALPILRALSFYLVQHNLDLPTAVITDLAFAYAKLNFYQGQILQKLVTDLLPKFPKLSASEITQCARSFATLKFSNLLFCEAVTQACLERSDSFTIQQLCSIVQTFAYLNFHPSQRDEFFTLMQQRLSSDGHTLKPLQLVDLVWSLCILHYISPSLIERVLEPAFYTKVLDETSPRSATYLMKLMLINATAQLECPEYQGPLLPPDVQSAALAQTQGRQPSRMQSGVKDVLKVVFPEDGTCNYDVCTVYGWRIDGEVVLDSENKPLILRDLTAPHVLHSEGTEPLPEGAKRFAFMCQNFSNFCFHTKDLLGQYVMIRRQVKAAGFLLVEVPYYDWQELKSDWQKSSFIKDQIKKVVAEEMAR